MSSRVLKAGQVMFMDPFEVASLASNIKNKHQEDIDAAYAAGLAAAQEEAMANLPRLLDSLRAAVDDVKTSWVRQAAEDRHTLVDMAAELAQWMVGRELRLDPSLAVLQADDVLNEINSDAPEVTVFVPPELVEVLESSWHPDRHASVRGDTNLLSGEMRVVAGVSTADLRWADALSRVHEALDVVDGSND